MQMMSTPSHAVWILDAFVTTSYRKHFASVFDLKKKKQKHSCYRRECYLSQVYYMRVSIMSLMIR